MGGTRTGVASSVADGILEEVVIRGLSFVRKRFGLGSHGWFGGGGGQVLEVEAEQRLGVGGEVGQRLPDGADEGLELGEVAVLWVLCMNE